MDIFYLWRMRHESIRHMELRQHKNCDRLTRINKVTKIHYAFRLAGRRVAEGRRKETDEGNRKARSIGAGPHRESKPGVRSPNIQTDGGTRPMSKLGRTGHRPVGCRWSRRRRRTFSSGDVVAMDETSIKCTGGPGRARCARRTSGRCTGKRMRSSSTTMPSRAHKHVEAFLGDFSGTLLSDGYGAYEAYAKRLRPGARALLEPLPAQVRGRQGKRSECCVGPSPE